MKKLVFMLVLFFAMPAFGNYRAMIATEMAAATMEVAEVKEKVPRSECQDCKGTGKVKAGDGVVVVERECDNCFDDGKGSGDAFVLEKTAIVVSADWCAPCQQLKKGPVAALKKEGYGIEVRDYKDPEVQKYGVKSLPTIIFLKDGKEFHRLTGYRSKETLEKYLSKPPTKEAPKQTRLTPAQLRAWCKTYRGQPYYVDGMGYKAHLMDSRATAHEGGPFQAWQLQGLTTSELMKVHGGQHTKKLTPWGVPP